MNDTPSGWQPTTYGAVLTETHERRGGRADMPVLSVTKSRGPMLASERFGKVLHGRDLAKYRVARRGTIVADPMLLWDGSIGRQDVADVGLVSPDYRVYQLADHASSDFMRYVVRNPSMLRHYQGGARGTNVRRNRIARGDFLRIPFRLPPLPEQSKIAAILSAVDEVIEKTESVIESLQTLKRAMMQELLTRGLPGRHTRFKQTEIGEIPEEWALQSVGDVVESCDYGLSEKMCSDARLTPILRMGNIRDGEVLLGDLKYVDDGLPTATGLHLAPGDVLFNRTNSKDLVGKVGVFLGAERPVTFASYLLRMKAKPGVATGSWLGAILNTARNQSGLRALATPGVSQANINRTKLLAFSVPTPPIDEQKEILATLDVVSSRIQSEHHTLRSTGTLKSALMSVLLTGELRVTPDEGAA